MRHLLILLAIGILPLSYVSGQQPEKPAQRTYRPAQQTSRSRPSTDRSRQQAEKFPPQVANYDSVSHVVTGTPVSVMLTGGFVSSMPILLRAGTPFWSR